VRIAGPEIAPASATPEGDGVISTQRIQAPLIISGPDRKPGSRGGIDDDDEDWFGNYA
jgi:hypothetical protein